MRLAVLSDAHCNSVGLAACLDRVRDMDVDAIYFLGDAVGYLSHPQRTLDLLREAGAHCQQGNHEAMLLGDLPLDTERDRQYRLTTLRESMDATEQRALAAWPTVRELDVDGVPILLSHGSPTGSIVERMYEDTPWTPPPSFPYRVVFIGHTHRAFVRQEAGVQLVNVGSCGLPRDRGDRAAFVIYDGATREAKIYRVQFDVHSALQLHGEGAAPESRALFERREEFHGEVV